MCVCEVLCLGIPRERTEKTQAEAQAREEELQQKVDDLDAAKKEVEESLEIHLEEASQQVNVNVGTTCVWMHVSFITVFSYV